MVGIKPHVVVVGAGIMGSTIAFYLSRHNVNVTIVDSFASGHGATKQSFAYINAFAKDPRMYHDLNRRSMDAWERIARLIDRDIGLRWGGQVTWVNNLNEAKKLKARVDLVQSWGYGSRIISQHELELLEPELSLGKCSMAALNYTEGHVNAPIAAQVLTDEIIKNGGVAYLNTNVTGLNLGKSGDMKSKITSIQTSQGEITCDSLVLAAGVASTNIASTVGIKIPQIKSPGFVVRVNPVKELFANISVVYAPSSDDKELPVHVRQMKDGSLMIGEGSSKLNNPQSNLLIKDSQYHANMIMDSVTKFLPALSEVKATPLPMGYRPMPLDGLPVIGFTDEIPNLYLAVMHSGVTLAPIIGELSTIEIIDGVKVDLLEHFRVERFLLN